MQTCADSDNPELVYSKQKEVIDIAYNLSPDYAKELADMFDCDPARMKARIDSLFEDIDKIKARFDLNDHLEMLKIKSGMTEKDKPEVYDNN